MKSNQGNESVRTPDGAGGRRPRWPIRPEDLPNRADARSAAGDVACMLLAGSKRRAPRLVKYLVRGPFRSSSPVWTRISQSGAGRRRSKFARPRAGVATTNEPGPPSEGVSPATRYRAMGHSRRCCEYVVQPCTRHSVSLFYPQPTRDSAWCREGESSLTVKDACAEGRALNLVSFRRQRDGQVVLPNRITKILEGEGASHRHLGHDRASRQWRLMPPGARSVGRWGLAGTFGPGLGCGRG